MAGLKTGTKDYLEYERDVNAGTRPQFIRRDQIEQADALPNGNVRLYLLSGRAITLPDVSRDELVRELDPQKAWWRRGDQDDT